MGFLEEVTPAVRKGVQSSAGRDKGWAPGWGETERQDGLWAAWHEGTGLAAVTIRLEARGVGVWGGAALS